MKAILDIFKQDLANIKRVPLVGLLLIGLAILPSLYAWFNLAASWDPYDNTEDLTVAVVNEDQGAEIDGETLHVGDELESSLEENEGLDWTFVTSDEAEEGVYYGDYYAAIYINEDFSSSLVSVIDGSPSPAEIDYEVNEKLNAIAPKMTEAGTSTIVNEISTQLIKNSSEALFTEFDRLGIALEEELPTIRALKQQVYDLEEKTPLLMSFGDIVISVDEQWDQIEEQVEHFLALDELRPEIQEGAEKILILEESLSEVESLGESVVEVETYLPEVKQSVDELRVIAEQIVLIEDYLYDGVMAVQELQDQIEDLESSLPAVVDQIEAMEQRAEALVEIMGNLNEGLDGFVDQLIEASNRMTTVLEDLSAGIEEGNLEQIESTLHELNDQLTSFDLLLEDMISKLETWENVDPSVAETIEQLKLIRGYVNESQQIVEQAIEELDQDEEISEQLIESISTLHTQINQFQAYMEADGREAIDTLTNEAYEQVENTHEQLDTIVYVLPQVEELINELDDMNMVNQEDLENALEDVPEVGQNLTEFIDQIEGALPQVETVLESVANFMENDFPELQGQIKRIGAFIREDLPEVEEQYLTVADMIEEHFPQIQSTVQGLAQFAEDDLPGLSEQFDQLATQVRELEEDDALSELITVLRHDVEEESEFFKEPVVLDETQLFPVPNYGSANSPFYTVLSLWIGALLLCNLLSTNVHKKDRKPYYKMHHMYLGRMILFLIVGILQGIVISLGNLWILGVYTQSPWWFTLFTVFIAVVFMLMVYTLTSVFGNIGKALAIVFLVLQLSGGGGMFPIEVAPDFFQAIHPYLPFTYAIDLLREAVGGIIPSVAWFNSIMLSIFGLGTILFGLIFKEKLADRIEETSDKSKSSRLIE
ncbi:YhgE/Pip domain-containing protein [Alkalibacillus silvisoli]|uniref:YhgE/Pip domain-containing protein n=1 Tax=Alkalibacillus silvisoli TaxID=392823 RepID=A0ABN0ZKG2_9BACI